MRRAVLFLALAALLGAGVVLRRELLREDPIPHHPVERAVEVAHVTSAELLAPAPDLLFGTAEGQGAELYRDLAEAAQTMEVPAAIDSFNFTLGDPVDHAVVAGILRGQEMKRLVEKLEQATRVRRCDWTYAEVTLSTELPHLMATRRVAELLEARAKLRLREGDPEGAVSDIVTLLKAGSDLLEDRFLISRFCGIAIAEKARFVLLQEVLGHPRRRLDPPLLRSLAAHLSWLIERYPSFSDWVQDENRVIMASLDEVLSKGVSATLGELLMLHWPGDSNTAADDVTKRTLAALDELLRSERTLARRVFERRWREGVSQNLEEARKPFTPGDRRDDRTGEAEKLRLLWVEMLRFAFGSGNDPEPLLVATADFLFEIVCPCLALVRKKHALGRLKLETMRTWCLIELHRQRTGRYPKSLEAIGHVPLDPYDGGVLKYVRVDRASRPEGFVITTAGEKGDHHERARAIEESGFDLDLYRESWPDAERTVDVTLAGVAPR